MKTIKLLLVGIGGWAFHYIDALLDTPHEGVEIAGLVDPYPSLCRRLDELLANGIPLYETMDEFYAEHSADLALITTPIQFHTEHILIALAHGSNVLCEKPLCADEKDIEIINEASQKAGRFVDIGYQWSHNPGVLKLKSDILSGMYGRPISFKNLTLWPRNAAYYKRGCGWAGKLYDSNGKAIFDSVANNATAHHLHNIFFLCGSDMRSSDAPRSFDAALMRTNKIESFDTCVISGELSCGASFLYAVSHATKTQLGPVCEYTFENGIVRLGCIERDVKAPHFIGTLNDGTVIDYGDPSGELVRKMWLCIEDARNEKLEAECCPVNAVAVHTRVINSLHRDFIIHNTRENLISVRSVDNDTYTYVKGLDSAMISIYSNGGISLKHFFGDKI